MTTNTIPQKHTIIHRTNPVIPIHWNSSSVNWKDARMMDNCLYWHNHHGLSQSTIPNDWPLPRFIRSRVATTFPINRQVPSSWCKAEATPICHLHQGNRSVVGSEGLLEKGVPLMDKWTFIVGFAQLFGLEWIWYRSWGFGKGCKRRTDYGCSFDPLCFTATFEVTK